MAKNIVLCADGTGNTVMKRRGSNVFKLFEALDVRDDTEQIAFYTDGVGTAGLLNKAVGGAFGAGLARNVKRLYLDLVRSYEVGDRIYLFGFSRGAFTVRTLAGFIDACGVMRLKEGDQSKLEAAVDRAYSLYRRRHPAHLQRLYQNVAARETNELLDRVRADSHHPARIEFLGVWDTVSALGFPIDEVADGWNRYVFRFKFRQTHVPQNTACARHALAIDDERTTFHPLLWTKAPGKDVKQVWFAGAHSNVGGGYPKQGLSLVTLDWMMTEAEDKGLRFIEDVRNRYGAGQNVHDKLHDSRAGAGFYYRYGPRDIEGLCNTATVPCVVHESVLERIRLGTDGYAPGNLPDEFELWVRNRDMEPSPQNMRLKEEIRADPGAMVDAVRVAKWYRQGSWLLMFAVQFIAVVWILRQGVPPAFARIATDMESAWVASPNGHPLLLPVKASRVAGLGASFTLKRTLRHVVDGGLESQFEALMTSGVTVLILAGLGFFVAEYAERRMRRSFSQRWFDRVFKARSRPEPPSGHEPLRDAHTPL